MIRPCDPRKELVSLVAAEYALQSGINPDLRPAQVYPILVERMKTKYGIGQRAVAEAFTKWINR